MTAGHLDHDMRLQAARCMERDEEEIYKLYPEAVTVINAYYIRSLALNMEYGEDK